MLQLVQVSEQSLASIAILQSSAAGDRRGSHSPTLPHRRVAICRLVKTKTGHMHLLLSNLNPWNLPMDIGIQTALDTC